MNALRTLLWLVLACNGVVAVAELPPVPVPAENPVTEPKRILGKILFWDEQLSSDDSIACGTCHQPAAGGADPRSGLNPGDLPGSTDDVFGSPGIRRLDSDGHPVSDPVFGDSPQVTARTAPSIFGALWAPELFWDGRAGSEFRDPDNGEIVVASGGALENQILMTLANPAEMTRPGRRWSELGAKLAAVAPLALADRWPEDIRVAIEASPSYPDLFAAAFGEESITPVRIALAIATYERTLVADATPWDRYRAGDESALDISERNGWQRLQALKCTNCHVPPLFTSNDFANIGIRRSEFDSGRAGVTGEAEDAGEMRIPSLRNAGLRQRFMHTGEFAALGAAVDFYRTTSPLPDVDQIPRGGTYSFTLSQLDIANIRLFLANGLTDPRVAAEVFPFDRPRLASERERVRAEARAFSRD